MLDKKNIPFVSIIIPFRNEEKFIASCIESVIANDYPYDSIEIILVNGISTDNSVYIINEYITLYPQIKIIENPKKIFPAAVNIGISNAKGDYIIIMGSHAIYDKEYISGCIDTALTYSADNTGGVLETIGLNNNFTGKLISYVLSSPFGVGNSTFRTGSKQIKEVDTVFGGCYKRQVFQDIGLFNENLVSSSDMDFNVRLKKNGGKTILNPSIKATYYTRNTFKAFIKNNFRNGFWAIYPMKFVNYIPVSIRHFIPFLFTCFVVITSVLSIFYNMFFMLLLAIFCIYFLTSYYFSYKYIKKEGIKYLLGSPFFFFFLHFSYGLGSSIAFFAVIFKKSYKNLFLNTAFYEL